MTEKNRKQILNISRNSYIIMYRNDNQPSRIVIVEDDYDRIYRSITGDKLMPEICRFYWIIIQMFFNDHDPPHFHARYGEFRAKIAINDLTIIEGELPRKGYNLVCDWVELHKDELNKEWELCKIEKPLFKIEPLK